MKRNLCLMIIGLVIIVGCIASGCARGDQPSWGEIGKTMTVRGVMKGLVSSQYIYYFVFDPDGNILTGPKDNPNTWDNYYVARYDGGNFCLLYTSDAADDLLCVDLGGRRFIKKKTT